ncbi:MAG: patatin-like phospholipase family protein [Candidatus Woesearchaeota archaeon]
MNNLKAPSFGIALSGGGARCAAHIGFLKAVDKKIRIKELAGASGGAIVATLYSMGKLQELEDFLMKITNKEITNFFKPSNLKDGLFDSSRIINFIRSFTGDLKLEELEIPVTIVASDITHNRPVYFRKGDAAKIVAASCAIPGLFSPIKIGNSYFVDGGLFNNTPADVLSKNIDFKVLVDAGIHGGIADVLKHLTLNYRRIKKLLENYEKKIKEHKKLRRLEKSILVRKIVRELKIMNKNKTFNTNLNKERYTLFRIIISSLDNFNISDVNAAKSKCDYYITPKIRISNLSFHKTKLAITPGEKSGFEFLEKLKKDGII